MLSDAALVHSKHPSNQQISVRVLVLRCLPSALQGQRLAAAHAALEKQHAAACRQVRVLRKLLACQRAAVAGERAARIAAETRYAALLRARVPAPGTARDGLSSENAMTRLWRRVEILAGGASAGDSPAGVAAGAAASQMEPHTLSTVAGLEQPLEGTSAGRRGSARAGGAATGLALQLTPAGGVTATPSVLSTVPERTCSHDQPAPEPPSAGQVPTDGDGDTLVLTAVKRRSSAPKDSRHADLGPTPRCVVQAARDPHDAWWLWRLVYSWQMHCRTQLNYCRFEVSCGY